MASPAGLGDRVLVIFLSLVDYESSSSEKMRSCFKLRHHIPWRRVGVDTVSCWVVGSAPTLSGNNDSVF